MEKKAAYEGLAEWFEYLNDDCGYEKWSQYLISKLKCFPLTTGLDVGCGSGILSIAALLLGARDAFACDIDDKCVGVAYENAALNGIGREHYTVRAGDVLSDKRLAREFGGDYDIVVANIVADVIIALAPQVRPLLKKGGLFLCSGIIDDRAVEVADALRLAGWAIMEARESEGWFSYLCK